MSLQHDTIPAALVPEPLSPYAQFLALSEALTGFDEFDLQGTGVGQEYLATLYRIVPGVVDDLLRAFAEVRAAAPDGELEPAIRRRILDDPRLGPVAQNVISMWYIGNWNQLPAQWRYAYGASPRDVTHVVSGLAYQEGLVWKAAGTHPQGARQPGFGTWALPPRA